MPRSQAQERLADNWINIVLTILSIVQGSVFSFLANQFLNTFKYSILQKKYIVLALFILCIAVALRVFQTYITALLDKEVEVPSFWDILLVILVGLSEYYIFSLFTEIPSSNFDVQSFQVKFYIGGIVLSFMGALGYFSALRRFKEREERRFREQGEPFKPDADYKSEVKLQGWNIFGMLAIMAIQLFLLYSLWMRDSISSFPQIEHVQILCVCGMIVILFVNTIYSIRVTFPKDGQMSKPVTQPITPESNRLEIDIVKPGREDVTKLRDLLIQHFGYIYITLFGNNKERASRILEGILKANGGNHSLGYKSFYIAHPKNRREGVVGVLRLETKSSAERYSKFVSTLFIIKNVLQDLGLRGMFRTWRNWQVIHGVSPKVATNELHIVYLAVSDDALNRQVGKQLLEYARVIAKDKDKEFISLSVRAKNIKAQDFFRDQGFSMGEIITDDEADNLLGQGASIRMTAEIPKLMKTN